MTNTITRRMAPPANQVAVDLLGSNGWPYGADDIATQRRLLEWARARGVQYEPQASCFHWISSGRCRWRDEGKPCRVGHLGRSWLEHLSGWTRNGKPAVLLSQPYHFDGEDLATISKFATQLGLLFTVQKPGWYGRGTKSIEFWPDPREQRCPF